MNQEFSSFDFQLSTYCRTFVTKQYIRYVVQE